MPNAVAIALERPDQPAIAAMLADLDHYLTALYPPEANHILDIEALLKPDIRFFVARRESVPVGCGALRLEEDYGEIKRMFVAPSARGLGLGKALLHAIEVHARGMGIDLLRLETGVRQPEAIGLYIAAGYAETAEFGDYPPSIHSRFFAKPLGPGPR